MLKILARGISVNLVGTAARVTFVFLHSFIAAYLFGAEEYGIYAIGISAVALLSSIGQVGFGRTLTRFVALYRTRHRPDYIRGLLRRVLIVSIILSSGITLAIALNAELIAGIFGEPELARDLPLYSLAIPVLSLAMLLAAFTQGFQRMEHKAIAIDMVRPGIELVAMLLLVFWGARRFRLAAPYLISIVAAALFLIHFVRIDMRKLRQAFPELGKEFSPPPWKPVVKFAMPILSVDILLSATTRASTLMLGALGTSAMVGVFSIIQRVVALGSTFLISTNVIFSPIVADLVERNDMEELDHLYKLTVRWILVISLPYFLLLLFYREQILQLFGAEFVTGGDALAYLVAASIFHVTTGSCGIILMMAGYPQYSAINEAIMLAIVVAGNLLLIPTYGLLGAVWSVAAGMIIVNTFRVIQVWWHLRVHPFSRQLWKLVTASTVMVIVMQLWKLEILKATSSWYILVLGAGLATLLFALTIILVGLEREELDILRTLLKRFDRTQITTPQ